MSSVFNTNSIMVRENNIGPVSDFMMYENSFTKEAMEYVLSVKEEYNMHVLSLYDAVLESRTETALNESFSDFTNKVREVIEKFIKFIKGLFSRFITMMNKMVMSDKYLKKHKDDFSKFDNEKHGFEFNGYYFTFDSDIPLNHAAKVEFEEDFLDLENIKGGIKEAYDKFKEKINNDFYDGFRMTLLDKHGEYVSNADYSKELFAFFRDENSSAEEFTVTNSIVTDAYFWFENFKDFEKALKKTIKEVENQYGKIKKDLENMITISSKNSANPLSVVASYDGSEYPQEISQKEREIVNKYIKLKTSQIVEMSNIHSIALGAKLDAYKDNYVQDKQILYKALQKIQSVKGE